MSDATAKPAPLPVIVGFGGYNAAGRSSGHQAYRRMVIESLAAEEREQTLVGLACLMQLVSWQQDGYKTAEGELLSAAAVAERFGAQVLSGTLIRKIENFDPDRVLEQKNIAPAAPTTFTIAKRDLPAQLPSAWQCQEQGDGTVLVTSSGADELLLRQYYTLPVKAAGQLPSGFDMAAHYNARFHPRGLQAAILGASDALHSTGIPLEKLVNSVRPDQVGTYSSSISQLTSEGLAGMLQSRLLGGRVTAKQLPLGLNSMPADFINAYVLGSVGHTEAITGACASFLYVLQAAVRDIASGARRLAIVGNAEAVATAEVIEGFAAMGALASDDNLCKLDGTQTPDWRRASRPFGENCGFTIGEGAQFVVLMDDALALELGADIQGAVPAVYINADGVKKSISAPGAGNYICFAKAVAKAAAIVGLETVRNNSVVYAHGSSTPANRITESHMFDLVAAEFGIENWPVTAPKSYLGHSLTAASGDQLISALGAFHYQWVPGIKTIDSVADDVFQQHLTFPINDLDCRQQPRQLAFINSKGFGGNNATGVVLAPALVETMLANRYGQAFAGYCQRREQTRSAAAAYQQRAERGQLDVIYRFGEDQVDVAQLRLNTSELSLPGYAHSVQFDTSNPWQDMTGAD